MMAWHNMRVRLAQQHLGWWRGALVFLAIVGVTVASDLSADAPLLVYKIFQYLYFLPVVVGSFWFGWRGALASVALTALSARIGSPPFAAEQYGELLDLLLVGLVVGLLAERDHTRERELRQAHQQLRDVYRELRTNFEQLRQAERLTAIGQLAASLAHEIRTPLASIEGSLDVLDSPATPAALRQEFVTIGRQECRRVGRLLTALLDYARPREPEFCPCDALHLVRSVVTLTQAPAQQSGVQITTHLPSELPALHCDADQVRQVLLNLVMNGIQAMPEGGALHVEARADAAGLVLQVRDEGPGIASEDTARLFEPFFTTKSAGTGLGLPVAHRIVRQHGGSIEIGANAPQGAVFVVTLPWEQKGSHHESQAAGSGG